MNHKYIKSVLILFFIFSCYLNAQQSKENKEISILKKKITYLEKKVEKLENMIRNLEKKISQLNKKDDFEISFISKDVVETKNKGVIKIEAELKNNTLQKVILIFGQIIILDPNTQRELYTDNFYYDKQIMPGEVKRIIIAVPSSHSSYSEIKDKTSLIIKFNPKLVKN